MDVEKAYWGLKGNNGKFDESVLVNIMSPPLPENLCRSECQVVVRNTCTCTCTIVVFPWRMYTSTST